MLSRLMRRDVLLSAVGGMASRSVVAPVPLITVSPPPSRTLTCGDLRAPCAIGRSGVRADKREGDGATPSGRFPLRRVLFRQDRIPTITSHLPVSPIGVRDGWSTDPADPSYNQMVTLPRSGPHEEMWRADGLYDVVVVIGYNDAPVVAGKGSAIFLHVARRAMSPTDGCVAVPLAFMLELLERCDTTTFIEISS